MITRESWYKEADERELGSLLRQLQSEKGADPNTFIQLYNALLRAGKTLGDAQYGVSNWPAKAVGYLRTPAVLGPRHDLTSVYADAVNKWRYEDPTNERMMDAFRLYALVPSRGPYARIFNDAMIEVGVQKLEEAQYPGHVELQQSFQDITLNYDDPTHRLTLKLQPHLGAAWVAKEPVFQVRVEDSLFLREDGEWVPGGSPFPQVFTGDHRDATVDEIAAMVRTWAGAEVLHGD